MKEAFKDAVQAALQTGAVQLIGDYLNGVMADGQLEDKRKAVQLIIDATGVSNKKEVDPYGGLPVVNVTFVQGEGLRAEVSVTPPAEVVEMGEADPETAQPSEAEPLPLPAPAISDDFLDDGFAELEQLDAVLKEQP